MTIFDDSQREIRAPRDRASLGVDRTLLAVLSAAYTEDEVPTTRE